MSQNHNFKRILILKFKFKKIIKIVYWKNANLFVKFATTTNCNNIQKWEEEHPKQKLNQFKIKINYHKIMIN